MGGGWGNAVVNPNFFDSMKEYNVIDVPQPDDCQNCTPCVRMRLLEMGFVPGQLIRIEGERLGLYIVHMLSENGSIAQTIALRTEEMGRVCLKERV